MDESPAEPGARSGQQFWARSRAGMRSPPGHDRQRQYARCADAARCESALQRQQGRIPHVQSGASETARRNARARRRGLPASARYRIWHST
jgi:hypothetical protein